MANITKMPKQFVGQLETKTITNPKLLTAIDADDSVIQLTQAILTADGNKPTDPFIIVIRNATTKYPETVYVQDPTTELSADGKTITLTTPATQRGIAPSPDDAGNVDFLSGTAARASAHPEGSEVRVSIHANLWAAMILALQGDIASGGATWSVGREIDEDIIWYAENGDANPPYFKYVSASNKFVVAADGVTEIDMASGGVTSAGDGISIVAAVISVDTADTNTFVKTSSGAADENKVPVLDANGELATGFIPDLPADKLTSISKFGGDGSDGALSVASGTIDIDLGGASVVTKQYSSISVTGTGQVTFSNPNAKGTIITLKCQNSCTITSSASPAIDASGMGASGGASNTIGSNGNSVLIDTNPGGAGDPAAAGTQPGGAGGAASSFSTLVDGRFIKVFVGAGGGGGGSSLGGSGGAGGRGGGCLIIQVAGSYSCSSELSVSGLDGAVGSAGGPTTNSSFTAGSGGGGGSSLYSPGVAGEDRSTTGADASRSSGGGGGGGGGNMFILYNTLTSDTGTYTVAGGSGGAGGVSGAASGGAGGAGGTGFSFIGTNTSFT